MSLFFLQTFSQRSGLNKHLKGRCIHQKLIKQVSFIDPTDEVKRNAEIAKAQFALLNGNYVEEMLKKSQAKKQIEAACHDHESDDGLSDNSVKLEIKTEEEMQEAEVGHTFVAINIKEEPISDFEIERFDISFEPDIVKQEDALDESTSLLMPIVLLRRLEQEEIVRWSRNKLEIKQEQFDTMQEIVDVNKSKDRSYDVDLHTKEKKIRKEYNSGVKRAYKKEKKLRALKFKKNSSIFTCDMCGETIYKKHQLHGHFQGHRREKKHPCKIGFCERSFRTLLALSKHQRDHGLKITPIVKCQSPFECDLCGLKLNSRSSFTNHLRVKHKLSENAAKIVPCHLCDKIFGSKMILNRHFISQHCSESQFICHVCAKGFKTSSRLKQHLIIHRTPEKCEHCRKLTFNLKQHLANHITPRKEPDRVPCPQCGKLISKFQIQLHVERVHAKSFNGKIFPCDICRADFTRREDLRQ